MLRRTLHRPARFYSHALARNRYIASRQPLCTGSRRPPPPSESSSAPPPPSHPPVSAVTHGGGGGGNTTGGGGYNCPRCAVPLTKFWQQDSPLWGCVDCREIYTGPEKSVPSGRLPRSWTASSVMTGALGPPTTSEPLVGGATLAAAPGSQPGPGGAGAQAQQASSNGGFSPTNVPPPTSSRGSTAS